MRSISRCVLQVFFLGCINSLNIIEYAAVMVPLANLPPPISETTPPKTELDAIFPTLPSSFPNSFIAYPPAPDTTPIINP